MKQAQWNRKSEAKTILYKVYQFLIFSAATSGQCFQMDRIQEILNSQPYLLFPKGLSSISIRLNGCLLYSFCFSTLQINPYSKFFYPFTNSSTKYSQLTCDFPFLLITSMAERKLFLQSSIFLGFLLAKHYTPHYLFMIWQIRIPFLCGSLNSCCSQPTERVAKYLSTVICIYRLTDGCTGFTYYFLAEPIDLTLLLERELLFVKDLFLKGVSIFLNFDRYKSLQPLSVLRFSSTGSSCCTSP